MVSIKYKLFKNKIMNTYFTADWHFGHEAIIDLSCRPFSKLRFMEKTIIRKFNEVVKEEDLVYVVGDAFWGKHSHNFSNIMKRLSGKKHLILGNHDLLKPFEYQEIGFTQVATWLKVEEFTVVHDPSASTIDRSTSFICGHIHDLFKVQKNVVNVGVDVWDFKPVEISMIRGLLCGGK